MRTRRVTAVLRFAAFALVVAFLWPASFGGATTLLVVSGTSMLPTYRSGDLVVVRAVDEVHVGDVVVVALHGHSRTRIVHRVIAVEPDGRFRTQGDNRITPDGLLSRPSDVIGTTWLRIPRGGALLLALSRWWVLGAVCGALAALGMWSSTEPRRRRNVVIPDELRGVVVADLTLSSDPGPEPVRAVRRTRSPSRAR